MIKDDLWCGYCRGKDFTEIRDPAHLDNQAYSRWECTNCEAVYEDNPGYGYFTTYWGNNEEGSVGKYSLATGEPLDDAKLPRTPEGLMRHSGSKEQLEAYLGRTQIK